MKKTLFSIFSLAVAALTFTACENVPAPYDNPNQGGGGNGGTTVTVEPTGKGTKEDPYNVASAINVIKALPADGQTEEIFVKGKVVSVKEIDTDKFGNATYYISDDGTANGQLYIFRSLGLGNKKFTSSDTPLKAGDEVIVQGLFTNFKGNTPETVTNKSWLYSHNGKTVDSGGGSSTVTGEPKGTGTQADPYNAVAAYQQAAALSADGKIENVYVEGIVSSIKEVNTQYGNATYKISVDGKAANEFDIYRGYYLNGAKFTSADQIKVGQKVVINGTLVNFKGNTPQLTQGSKLISIDGKTDGGDNGGSTGGDNGGSTGGDNQGTTDGININGTTVTITNAGITAGTNTQTIDLSTLGFTNQQKITEVALEDGTKIIFDKNNETNGPTYYDGTKGIRVYKNNTITFNAIADIAQIVFECDSFNGTDYVGNKTATISFNGKTAVYTNVYTEPSGGGVQLRVKKITITYAK